MPVNERLMANLKRQYGAKKGEEVYYKMESKGHPATKVKRGKARKHRKGSR